MTGSTFGIAYLAGLFGVVAFGALVPVVPTGAAVSVGAALAERDHYVLILLVVVFGAAGAYLGDLAAYAAIRLAGRSVTQGSGRVAGWLHSQSRGRALDRVEAEIEAHELRTLLLSRLVPGGRIPVLLAAAVGGYPWRRYAVADMAAAILWSAMYAASGLLGRAVFPKAWEGAVAGVALVLIFSAASNFWSRRRRAAGAVAP